MHEAAFKSIVHVRNEESGDPMPLGLPDLLFDF